MNLKMFRRKVSVFGVALASMFGAPMPIVKKNGKDDIDPTLNIVNEEGIISTEEITQGTWHSFDQLDEYLYRHESLENLVSHENEINGKFWKTATFLIHDQNRHILRGIRSDDKEFFIERTFDLKDKKEFNQMCQDFNNNLRLEIA